MYMRLCCFTKMRIIYFPCLVIRIIPVLLLLCNRKRRRIGHFSHFYGACWTTSNCRRASWIRTSECRDQNPVPYRLAIALSSQGLPVKNGPRLSSEPVGWVEGLEPSVSRTTIWRVNQLRHTHHTFPAVHFSILPDSVPKGIRTPDPRLRRPLLYPAELWTLTFSSFLPDANSIISNILPIVKHRFWKLSQRNGSPAHFFETPENRPYCYLIISYYKLLFYLSV